MLVCVNRRSSAAEPIRANGVFHVNVLRDSQAHLSDIFAGRTRLAKEEKFPAAEWATETTGAPRIADPLVAFDCRLLIAQEIGTHYVFVGAVQSVFLGEPGMPLHLCEPRLWKPNAIRDRAASRRLIGFFTRRDFPHAGPDPCPSGA